MSEGFKPSGFRLESIVGRVVAPAEEKFNGDQTELRIAVGHGYLKDKGTESQKFVDTGTTWVTYIAGKGYGEPLKAFGKGDLIEIAGGPQLVTRNYEKDGNPTGGAVVEARFGKIELLQAKGEATASQSTAPNKGFA